ncbi:MAG: sigma factor-like helix-turn-helix DNA-binding protein [Opitutaceae bacterium]|jgi:DNA-directed RNA polymerase sigma subunit (sigma70/sigma32)
MNTPLDNYETIERTKALMHRVFGQPRTLQSVATEMGLSRERVRCIERRAFLHLGKKILSDLQK